jgi:hypothetical protein
VRWTTSHSLWTSTSLQLEMKRDEIEVVSSHVRAETINGVLAVDHRHRPTVTRRLFLKSVRVQIPDHQRAAHFVSGSCW